MNILFKTTSELKTYVSINKGMAFDTIKPFLEEATTLYMIDLLGETFHEEIFTAYYSDSLSADQTKLLPYIQRTLALYAMFLSVNHLNVNIGDAGIHENRSNESSPVPKYKTDDLKLSYINQADLHAEKLLAYLEANSGLFTTWTNSTANTAANGLLVPTAKVASEHIDINDSRILFKKLIKRIKRIEAQYINKLVGQEQYDELVTQIKTDAVTADNQLLIDILRPIVSKKSLLETLPSMLVAVSANGIHIITSNDGTVTKSAADQNQLKLLMNSLKDSETGYMADQNELEQFIIDNIEAYPLIEASSAYTSRPDPGPKHSYQNLSTNKHFGI